MDDRFLHGLIGSPTKVCHYRLKAFTSWHLLLLSAVKSPIIETDKDCTIDDLLVCLKVIQSQWPEVPELKPTLRDKWWAFRMKHGMVARYEFDKFSEWLKVQLSFPEFWEKEGDDTSVDTSNMPTLLSLIAGIICNSTISLQQAWNMRLAEARWYQAAIAQNNGAEFKIVDESQPMPELGEVDPDEAVKVARETLPPAVFEQWYEGYKLNQKQ